MPDILFSAGISIVFLSNLKMYDIRVDMDGLGVGNSSRNLPVKKVSGWHVEILYDYNSPNITPMVTALFLLYRKCVHIADTKI